MTDFNINRDKNLNTGFNTNRQAKGNQPDAQAEQSAVPPATDPYADLKTDPDTMMNLLAAHSMPNAAMQITNSRMDQLMAQFSQQITPEAHAQLTDQITKAYQDETGKTPSPEFVQDVLDNYLMGQVVIQNS
jgi:hypothetical protein